MPGIIVIILLFICAITLVLVSCSFFKAICDGPPSNRTAPSAAASTTAAATSNNIMTATTASQDVLSRLPVFVYSSAAQKKKLNCSVCLMDFKEGERGRFLPRCFHCFHVDCIDMWLSSHLECPVCRASVDPQAPEVAV